MNDNPKPINLNLQEDDASRPAPERRKLWLSRRAFKILVGVGVGLVAILGYEAITWPEVKALARQNPCSFAALEQSRAEERREGKTLRLDWQWVSYDQVSPNLKRAVLVAEDINFFSHHGFDAGEIESAAKDAVESVALPRGASTLTQQVARTLWLSPAYSPLRKFKEMLLTISLERHLSKKRIFELYLNLAEFGPDIFGAEAASRHYFHCSAAELSETEAAELAAGLSRVSLWNPASPDPAYHRQSAMVLRRMNKAQFLRQHL